MLTKLWLKFLLWLELRGVERGLNRYIDGAYFGSGGCVEVDEDRLLAKAVTVLKRKVNASVDNRTSENYHKKLLELGDLISLTTDTAEVGSKVAAILNKIVAFKDKDVRDQKDREAMIRKRIEHYYQLHDKKMSREMIRKIRELRKDGEIEVANELEKIWKERYGKEAISSR